MTSHFEESIIVGHAADVGLGGDQLGEAVHRRDAVDHPLVHVDVDDLRAGLDLLAGDGERGRVVAGLDQVPEAGGAGDVGALADVDEQGVLGDGQRLEAGQPQRRPRLGRRPRRPPSTAAGDRGDVRRRRAAAAADEVDEPAVGELRRGRRRSPRASRRTRRRRWAGRRSDSRRRTCRRCGRARRCRAASPWRPSAQLRPTSSGLHVPDRVPERLGDLAGQRAPGGVGDRAGDHHRPAAAALLEQRLQREDRRLGVQRVEDRLDEQHVGAAVDQPVGLLQVGRDQLVEGDVAGAGVVDVGRDGRRPAGRAERADDVARLVRGARGHRVARRAGQPGRGRR